VNAFPSIPRVLVLGYGNPGRLDDGLGAAVVREVGAMGLPGVEAEHDYQLNIEHAARIIGCPAVIFADACVGGQAPWFFRRLTPRRAESFSSHVMRPEAVLSFAADAFGWDGRAYLLGVRGHEFNAFEERLSGRARADMARLLPTLRAALESGDLDAMTTAGPLSDSATACNGGDPCVTTSM